MKKLSTKQIGDGRLPNKYWVSISSDYLYEAEPGHWDWDSDRSKKEPDGKTVGVFSSYAKARAFFDSIPMRELLDGVMVHTKQIEDRISGQLTEETDRETTILQSSETEDLGFTKARMSILGVSFK